MSNTANNNHSPETPRPTEAATPPRFTVFMHPDLVERLDQACSPMDGMAAIEAVFRELPLRHPSEPASPGRTPKRLRCFRAKIEWLCIGFDYAQIGSELHIVSVWESNGQDAVDVVLDAN